DKMETIKDFLNNFLDETNEKLSLSYSHSPNLDKTDYLKVIFSCAFYLGICKILSTNNIPEKNTEPIEITKLRESFKNIYSTFKLELNDVVLGNEVDKIQKEINKLAETWTPLITCLYSGDKIVTSPQKRNFFAHAGFEGNLTECMRQEGKIYLRYNEDKKSTIENWLKESI
ncbi:MAG: hypothetical protein N2511_08720, partial [Thermodesulfovibrionales bacterium]|nr:hypothetical protein [Thermodesulfovibrionales bacterium]